MLQMSKRYFYPINKNQIVKNIILIIMIFLFSSCKSQINDQQQCIETANRLLNYFKTKDTKAISNLIGIDLKSAGKTMSFIEDECNDISENLKQFGFPQVKDFEYAEYPNDPIDNVVVTILIKDSVTNSIKSKIEVYFAPENIISHTKISTYRIIPILENLNLSPPTKFQ